MSAGCRPRCGAPWTAGQAGQAGQAQHSTRGAHRRLGREVSPGVAPRNQILEGRRQRVHGALAGAQGVRGGEVEAGGVQGAGHAARLVQSHLHRARQRLRPAVPAAAWEGVCEWRSVALRCAAGRGPVHRTNTAAAAEQRTSEPRPSWSPVKVVAEQVRILRGQPRHQAQQAGPRKRNVVLRGRRGRARGVSTPQQTRTMPPPPVLPPRPPPEHTLTSP